MQNYYQRPPFRQPYKNQDHTGKNICGAKENLKKEFPVAMAYVPWQRYMEPYPVCRAFIRGTIFEELDKPFLGKGGCCS